MPNEWKPCTTPEEVMAWVDKVVAHAVIRMGARYKDYSAHQIAAQLEESRDQVFNDMLTLIYGK